MVSWTEHDKILHQLVVAATSDLVSILSGRPDITAAQVGEIMVVLSDRYGKDAAASAFQALRSSREAQELWDLLPRPEVIDPADAEQVRAATAWALQTRRFDGGLPVAARLKQLTGVLNRLVRHPAHETVWEATRTAGTRFARAPTAKACAFCLMLSSRGAVYTSRYAASTTSGERGTRPEGLRFHDHCNCLVVESYTDADLPQVVLDLQNEWAFATADANGSRGKQAAWEAHVKATRPLGSAIREVHSDGTATVYPAAEDVKIDATRLLKHARFNPKRPGNGGHTLPAALEIQKRLQANELTLRVPKTFDKSGSEWFADSAVVQTVIEAPDRVTKTRIGYNYEKIVSGPAGDVRIVVQTGRKRRSVRSTSAWAATSVYPAAGADVGALNYDGTITDVPL